MNRAPHFFMVAFWQLNLSERQCLSSAKKECANVLTCLPGSVWQSACRHVKIFAWYPLTYAN